jgi:hypothetical protein
MRSESWPLARFVKKASFPEEPMRPLILLLALCGCNAGKHSAQDAAPLGCSPSSATVPDYQSDGSGGLTGDGVSATLCHVWAHVLVSPYTTPPGRALLMLNSPSDEPPHDPGGASGGLVIGTLGIGSPRPGVYRSTDSGACGQMEYDFQRQLPAGTDCDAGMPPACPQYCASICSSLGCLPCAPNPPSVDYQAAAASDCLVSAQSVAGSWEIQLTSAAPVAGPDSSSGDYYLVHGGLTANLQADGRAATLTLGF